MNEITKMVQELEAMCSRERAKLLIFAKRILPQLTSDDILQPQDYPELEHSPEFRYAEGVCIGLETALSTLYAMRSERL